MPSAAPQAPPEMNSCNRPGRLQEMKSKHKIGRGDCTPRNYFAFAAGAQAPFEKNGPLRPGRNPHENANNHCSIIEKPR